MAKVQYSIAGNQLDVGSGGYLFWNGSSFGADQEVFVTLTDVDPDGAEQDLLLKSQSDASYSSGVIEVLYDAANSRVQVWTYTMDQGWVQRGADIPAVLAEGDQFGARATSDGKVGVYRNGTLLETRDVTDWPYYADGGYIGLWFYDASAATADNLGGGTVTMTSTQSFSATTTAIRYTYDPLQRLTGATYSGAYTYTFAYVYDAVGNRTAQTQTITSTLVTTYTYDAANRLTAVNGQAYTWDANGNLKNDGSNVYTYTQANRLITVTAAGLTWNAAYNGDGARLRQVTNGVPTTYMLDLAAPLPVVLQAKTGMVTTLYLFDSGTRPLAQYDSSAWEYLLPDGLGSVRQIADAAGDIKLIESYEPYGSVLSSQGSATSVFGFTGEQTDSTGLVFLRARYMQPGLGVFLSKDPWSGDDNRPVTQNGFLYADGSPINAADASGMGPPFFIVGYVQNSSASGGLALRDSASSSARMIKRMPDGTRLNLWIGPWYEGNTQWWTVQDPANAWGWAAAWQNGVQYISNVSPPPLGPQPQPTPSPGPGGGSRLTQLPLDSPRYDDGYGRYSWGIHDGYDIVSQSGNRTVYSMGPGIVDSMDTPNKPGVICSICGVVTDRPEYVFRVKMDTGYYIVYVHIKETALCIEDRVAAGTVIGEYDQVGQSDYPHVHVKFESPKGSYIDPGPYWPGQAPTEWHWGNPDPM